MPLVEVYTLSLVVQHWEKLFYQSKKNINVGILPQILIMTFGKSIGFFNWRRKN